MNVIGLMGAEVHSVRILARTDVVVTVFGCGGQRVGIVGIDATVAL